MLNRREALFSMLAAVSACAAPASGEKNSLGPLPDQKGDSIPKEATDDVDALLDTLLPSEPGIAGAREAGAGGVLAMKDFGRIAFDRGFIPVEPPAFETVRAALNADLARIAFPLARFADHPRERREQLIQDAMVDKPIFAAVRAACFFAWLGGFTNDLGLQAVGFPPYENLEDGLAVSGYPRTLKDGTLDDYTYDRAPVASIDLGLDINGDLP